MTNTNGYNEKSLLKKLSDGEETAIEQIYSIYWRPLFIYGYNILKDKAACEDILQDLFLQLWVKRESLNIKESLDAYLHAAVRYQIFRYIKNNPAENRFFENLDERVATTSSDSIIDLKEINQLVNNVVNELPEKCRTVFILSREQQLSHKEIANQLHISTKTVENQITIALHRLRSSLAKLVSFLPFF